MGNFFQSDLYTFNLKKHKKKTQQHPVIQVRIVTGLSVIASRNSLYLETELEPLKVKRDRFKLSSVFKIHNNLVPSYLTPVIRNVTSYYNNRHSSNYSLPRC